MSIRREFAPWFLTSRSLGIERQCQNCLAPATGYNADSIKLCCGGCLSVAGCQCQHTHIQRQIAEEMPVEHPAFNESSRRRVR